MKKTLLTALMCALSFCTIAQRNSVIGIVVNKATGAGVSGVMIGLNDNDNRALTDNAGNFRLTITPPGDTLIISHVGFKTVLIPLHQFINETKIQLEEYALELKTVVVNSRSLNMKQVESDMRLISGSLYAHNKETTNGLYNLFLSSLEDANEEVFRRCNYDLSSYNEAEKEIYKKYSGPFKRSKDKKDTTERDFSDFPAVNVSHEGAVLFCEWLTLQYNSGKEKRKFKKVKFRLPTLQEWQIAALGYPKFQSWKLEENYVEVIIPTDTTSGVVWKGTKSKVFVGKDNIYYPWYNGYNYRKKPYNHVNCYLGNFKVDGSKPVCNNVIKPGGDGWTMMSQTESYYPNDMGLYDVVGNVAEMIDEEFKACGGSWNDVPFKATIHSVKSYRRPNDTVGFRIFMEVLEK